MTDRCVMCGEIVPEGRQVCPMCEQAGVQVQDEVQDARNDLELTKCKLRLNKCKRRLIKCKPQA